MSGDSHGSGVPGWAVGAGIVGVVAIGLVVAWGTYIDPKSPRAAADTSSSLVGQANAGQQPRVEVKQEGPNHKLDRRTSFSSACPPSRQYACVVGGKNGTCCDRWE